MSMYRGNEGGSVWVYFYKHISQVPSTLWASFQISCLAIVPVQAERPFQPFQSDLWDCTRMGQSDMILTVQTAPAEQQISPGTPVHKDLLPAARMCTSNQTPKRSWRGRTFSWKGLWHLPDSSPAAGTLLHHWLWMVYNLSRCSQPHQKISGNAGTWSRAPRGAGGEGKLMSSRGKERCRYKQSRNEIKEL